MQPFTSRVVEIVQSIPEGRVMTYGQIACMAGSPRAARQVVRILHALSGKYRLPWHRVVNAQGAVAIKDREANEMQRIYLQQEGIEFDPDGRINLAKYGVTSP